MLKYGYISFSLEILEYCNEKIVLKREQYYLDLLNPDYNILKIANSRFGSKLSDETKAKIRSYRHTPEAIAKIKLKGIGKKLSFETIAKI